MGLNMSNWLFKQKNCFDDRCVHQYSARDVIAFQYSKTHDLIGRDGRRNEIETTNPLIWDKTTLGELIIGKNDYLSIYLSLETDLLPLV